MDPSTLIGLDFETYCELNLKEVGLARYINHPTFTVTLAGIETENGSYCEQFPKYQSQWLRDMMYNRGVSAHNAGFEDAVLRKLGFEDVPLIDSAVVAAVAGADRYLAGAARQLLNMGKYDEDRSLINLFAKPQKDQASGFFDMGLLNEHPDEWLAYQQYCMRDAKLSRDLVLNWRGHNHLFKREMQYAQITLDMNKAGWPVDMASVMEMSHRYQVNLEQIEEDFRRNVDPDLNLASHVQIKKWCADRGVRSSSFDKQHVEQLITRLKKLPHPTHGHIEVLRLLRVKQALGGSSLKKLETIIDTAFKTDGQYRVYDQYVHAGAPQSLRTSGRSVQMQNLPRLPKVPRDMDHLHHPNSVWTNEELGENLRQVFTSSHPQGALLVADFASIESRALAYLADETWKVDAYRQGQDVYKSQAMKIYNIADITAITKEQRMTGKVGELSCGYGAGPVAVKDFAEKMGVAMTETEAGTLVRDWREANPQTVIFWDALGSALMDTVRRNSAHSVHSISGVTIKFVPTATPASLLEQDSDVQSISMQAWKDGRLILARFFHGCYLRGRNIGYYKPSSLKGGNPWKKRYVDPKTKRPKFYELYGGKLAGILTQSLCREIFFESLAELTNSLHDVENATIVGQFHDEIVVDWVPGPYARDYVMALMESAMCHSPTHPSLPMAVEVKYDYRYTK